MYQLHARAKTLQIHASVVVLIVSPALLQSADRMGDGQMRIENCGWKNADVDGSEL